MNSKCYDLIFYLRFYFCYSISDLIFINEKLIIFYLKIKEYNLIIKISLNMRNILNKI
jgi:hypothetical protein